MTEPRNLHDVLTAILAQVPDGYRRTQMDAYKPESMHDNTPPWFVETEGIQTRCRFMPPELGRDEAWWWEVQHSLDEFFLGFDASVVWHVRVAEIWTGASALAERESRISLDHEERVATAGGRAFSLLMGAFAEHSRIGVEDEVQVDADSVRDIWMGMGEESREYFMKKSSGEETDPAEKLPIYDPDKRASRDETIRPSLPADPDLLFLNERTTGAWEVVDAATKSCAPFAVGDYAACMAWLDLNLERFSAKARGE